MYGDAKKKGVCAFFVIFCLRNITESLLRITVVNLYKSYNGKQVGGYSGYV